MGKHRSFDKLSPGIDNSLSLDSHVSLGKRIRYLRKLQKMTQFQLACILGVSEIYICQFECGKKFKDVKLGSVKKLARALDCDLIIRIRPRWAEERPTAVLDGPTPKYSEKEVPHGQRP